MLRKSRSLSRSRKTRSSSRGRKARSRQRRYVKTSRSSTISELNKHGNIITYKLAPIPSNYRFKRPDIAFAHISIDGTLHDRPILYKNNLIFSNSVPIFIDELKHYGDVTIEEDISYEIGDKVYKWEIPDELLLENIHLIDNDNNEEDVVVDIYARRIDPIRILDKQAIKLIQENDKVKSKEEIDTLEHERFYDSVIDPNYELEY